MEGSYSQGGAPPPQMMGYFQGMQGYNMQQQQQQQQPQQPPQQNPQQNQPPNTHNNSNTNNNNNRSSNVISIWAGDLDSYMDENFLRQAVTASGWGSYITRIKVVRDHYSGAHSGYGFLDAASPEAAQRVIADGSGMPIPGTNRCWRLNMGRNASISSATSAGSEINIYVGNLEHSVTDYQLMTAFRPRYASVRHAKVVCNEYGQSRGFGFIRFTSQDEAERAVNEMQGYEFNHKPIRLSHATGRTRTQRGNTGGGSHNSYNHSHHNHHGHGPPTNKRPRQLMSPDDPNNTTIFIGGTSPHIDNDLLWREFSSFGELDGVRVPVNKTGFAFVRFKTRDCAQRAKTELSGTEFHALNPNKPIRIEWAAEQIPSSKPPMAQQAMPNMYPPAPGNAQPYDPQYSQYQPNPVASNTSLANNSQTNNDNYGSASQNNNVNNAQSGVSMMPNQSSTAAGDNKSVGNDLKTENGRDTTGNSVTKEGQSVSLDNITPNGNGETEPPSKRAAVGRPEYTDANVDDPSKKDISTGNKTEGPSEDSPAMQFSWLNASSSQPNSNQQ